MRGEVRPFRYEHRRQQLLSRRHFIRRLLAHFSLASTIVGASLIAGMSGYVYFEHLSWIDAFLNAAMLLGGMGPVDDPKTDWGKLFAGTYALFAGLIVIVVTGIMLGPVVHRIMHRFHWEEGRSKS
jgi:hypothetical protein